MAPQRGDRLIMKIDLLVWEGNGETIPDWHFGASRKLKSNPRESAAIISSWIQRTDSDYAVFWDLRLPLPAADQLMAVVNSPGHGWHVGLLLGTQGLPRAIDRVCPGWMLNQDPQPRQTCTSWRLSSRACVFRTDVLRQMGAPDPEFQTLKGAWLDYGFRLLKGGVVLRHEPSLLSPDFAGDDQGHALPASDEFRFVLNNFGRRWFYWSVFRSVLTLQDASGAVASLFRFARPVPRGHGRTFSSGELEPPVATSTLKKSVSVLIPTLRRYAYVWNTLEQLRDQTVPPLEIIVVDQTPRVERQTGYRTHFAGLPLRIIEQDVMGQCTAWNAALESARGEFLLFLGDDADEIPASFLEEFLRTMILCRADMVASTVEELGAVPPDADAPLLKVSDCFPIAMVRRDVLVRSGLMDYAFDRGARADADLGLRCYLSGALMLQRKDLRVFHHRAPAGGLRTHKARVVTYASSRQKLTHRHLPSITEIYMARRHLSSRQVRETMWLRVLGTFSTRGGWFRKASKILVSTILLPHTLWIIRKNWKEAAEMVAEFPRIPKLSPSAPGLSSGPQLVTSDSGTAD
jgi:glycosyltransferase involved in cell wall biosynthesis